MSIFDEFAQILEAFRDKLDAGEIAWVGSEAFDGAVEGITDLDEGKAEGFLSQQANISFQELAIEFDCAYTQKRVAVYNYLVSKLLAHLNLRHNDCYALSQTNMHVQETGAVMISSVAMLVNFQELLQHLPEVALDIQSGWKTYDKRGEKVRLGDGTEYNLPPEARGAFYKVIRHSPPEEAVVDTTRDESFLFLKLLADRGCLRDVEVIYLQGGQQYKRVGDTNPGYMGEVFIIRDPEVARTILVGELGVDPSQIGLLPPSASRH